MKKNAILGLLMVIILPLTGYYIVKYFSGKAVQMPERFFYDSVAVIEKNGCAVIAGLHRNLGFRSFPLFAGGENFRIISLNQLQDAISTTTAIPRRGTLPRDTSWILVAACRAPVTRPHTSTAPRRGINVQPKVRSISTRR